MNRIFKEYLPHIEFLDINTTAKDYRLTKEVKIETREVDSLCSLR